MLPLFLLIPGCALASSVLLGRAEAEMTEFVNALSIPGVDIRRAPVLTTKPLKRRTGDYLGLTRLAGHSQGRHSAASLLAARQLDSGKTGSSNVSVVDKRANQYYVDVLLGGAPMKLLLDSSSSDTWVRAMNFTCLSSGNATDNATSPSCDLGPAWPDITFPEGPIRGQHFYIGYPNNDTVAGPLGLLDIDIAGVTVRQQEMGLATEGSWSGNNVTSGVLGMAYPSLTSAYWGDDLSSHNSQDAITYSPLFTSMVANESVEPYWALAICRNSTGGMFSIGSMPPVDRNGSHTAKTFLFITDIAHKGTTGYKPSYYTVIPSAMVLERVKNYSKYPYIIDSSTASILVPPDIAELVNQKFDPPGIYMWYYSAWFVDCDAIAPRFGIEIGGTSFFINPVDMVNKELRDPLTGMCASTIGSGENGPFVLGIPFLTNVVVSFDVGASTITFWSREFY